MKLSKIYANKEDFTQINFEDGFNVIYGDVESNRVNDAGKVEEHNLGKTSLVRLLDFMLLKGVTDENIFSKNESDFRGWIFFLEIKLNNGDYLTIKRGVDNNSKISLKIHKARDKNFINETDWTHENLALKTKNKELNPKTILDGYLGFNVASTFSYRDFLAYLLREQDDYTDVFLLEETYEHKRRKPLLFNILGFQDKYLKQKYSIDDNIQFEKKIIKHIQDEGGIDQETFTIKEIVEAKERELKNLKSQISSFDFYKNEAALNRRLIEDTEAQIAEFNKKTYYASRSIEEIRKALDENKVPTLRVEDIQEIFSQTEIFFPDNLKKSYRDLRSFAEQITKEREKYLVEELKGLESDMNLFKKELKRLNATRVSAFSVLNEKDTFNKYRKLQGEITQMEFEIDGYKSKLASSKSIEDLEVSIESNEKKKKVLSENIRNEIISGSDHFQSIKYLFRETYKYIFEYTALLVVEPNKNGNVEFKTPVLNESKLTTGKDDGHTSKRVLCFSFILSVLAHYSTQSFFRFAYFDGLLEVWGTSHKIMFLKLIRKYCKEYDIQLIISLIKSDIPTRGFSLEEKEIVRVLTRKDTLFGIDF